MNTPRRLSSIDSLENLTGLFNLVHNPKGKLLSDDLTLECRRTSYTRSITSHTSSILKSEIEEETKTQRKIAIE
jgi:hypothetical protein